MAFGLSTMAIVQGLVEVGGGSHVVIDPNQRTSFEGIGLAHLERAGWNDRVQWLEESSHRALPRLEAEGRQFNLAFVDGLHLFDWALVELFYLDRMLPVGGLMLLDDIGYPAIAKVVRFATGNLGHVEESRVPARVGRGAPRFRPRGAGRRGSPRSRGLRALRSATSAGRLSASSCRSSARSTSRSSGRSAKTTGGTTTSVRSDADRLDPSRGSRPDTRTRAACRRIDTPPIGLPCLAFFSRPSPQRCWRCLSFPPLTPASHSGSTRRTP